MSVLSEKYYGNKKAAVVLSKAGFMNNAFSGIRNKNGYFGVCNNAFEFKDFLPKPGIDESDEFGDPDYYFDSYEEVKEFGIDAFVIDASNVYSNDSESVSKFNEIYSTNFNSFDEVYDYAASDGKWTENDEYEDYGLSFSANVVENFRSVSEASISEEENEFDPDFKVPKLPETGNNKKVAVLFEADDCETIYGVLDADFAEEIRSGTRHSDYPVGCLDTTDLEPSKDGKYFVLIDNDAYEVAGLFSSEDSMRAYMSDNDIEDYQFYICQKGHFLGWNDDAVNVINELRKTTDFKNVEIFLHLKDEYGDIDYEFDRTLAEDDKPKTSTMEGENMKTIGIIHDTYDNESLYGAFTNVEDARLIVGTKDIDSLSVEEYNIEDEDGGYCYWAIDTGNDEVIGVFGSKEKAYDTCSSNYFDWEIITLKFNTLYDTVEGDDDYTFGNVLTEVGDKLSCKIELNEDSPEAEFSD